MLDYNAFKQEILEMVKEEYTDNINITVELRQVTKTNGVKLDGLFVWEKRAEGGDMISPTVYLERYYTKYNYLGVPLEKILQEIMDVMKTRNRDDFMPHNIFGTWEEKKKDIRLQLLNLKDNMAILETCLHEQFLDLAVVPRLIIEKTDDGITTMRIDDSCLKMWNVTKQEVFDAAYHNLKQEVFTCMSLSEILGMELEENVYDFHVLTNEESLNGSVSMLRNDMLRNFSDKNGGVDVFIVPSSLHEVLLLCDYGKDEIDAGGLKSIIRSANRSVVSVEDKLSDSLYKYDAVKGEVVIVE